MSTIYSIRDWEKHFENNRTRELKELRFVIMPNKHDGDGYTELLDHPNGAAHYGAWCSIVQVASKGQHPAGGCGNPAGCCECRGILLREGARPHDSASLSRLTRIPAQVYEEVLPRLVDIGWLEVLQTQTQQNQVDRTIPQDVGTKPHPPAGKCDSLKNGMEGNGIEKKEEVEDAASPLDVVFSYWQKTLNHPRAVLSPERKAKIQARLKDSTVDEIKRAIDGCKASDFHMGRTERSSKVFDDIELICRTRSKLESFIAEAGKVNGNGNASKGLTRTQLAEMLK